MNASRRPGFVNHLMLCTVLGLGVTGSAGLGAVWAQHQYGLEAARNKAIEDRISEVVRQSEELTTDIARERDPAALLRRNAEWNLGLVPAAAGRTQPISEDPVLYLTEKNNRETFGVTVPAAARFKLD